MGDEYGYSERRKNKNDKRAKRRFMMFRRGGRHRADNLNIFGRDKK